MTDTTIRCFLSVCGTLNITSAADLMHMTQQAVSKQILSLEKEIGYPLFIRGYHSLELTEIGRLYYSLFQQWQEEWRDASNTALRLAKGETNAIRIAYLKRLKLPDELYQVISNFKKSYPETMIQYSQTAGNSMVQALLDDELDLCIGHAQLFTHKLGLELCEIQEERKYLTISKRHPSYYENMGLPALQDVVYLFTVMEDQTVRSAIDDAKRALTPTGIGIREYREADSDEALYLSVAMGEGVTIASNVTTIFAREDIAAFPLPETSRLAICWNPENPNYHVRTLFSAISEGLGL